MYHNANNYSIAYTNAVVLKIFPFKQHVRCGFVKFTIDIAAAYEWFTKNPYRVPLDANQTPQIPLYINVFCINQTIQVTYAIVCNTFPSKTLIGKYIIWIIHIYSMQEEHVNQILYRIAIIPCICKVRECLRATLQ